MADNRFHQFFVSFKIDDFIKGIIRAAVSNADSVHKNIASAFHHIADTEILPMDFRQEVNFQNRNILNAEGTVRTLKPTIDDKVPIDARDLHKDYVPKKEFAAGLLGCSKFSMDVRLEYLADMVTDRKHAISDRLYLANTIMLSDLPLSAKKAGAVLEEMMAIEVADNQYGTRIVNVLSTAIQGNHRENAAELNELMATKLLQLGDNDRLPPKARLYAYLNAMASGVVTPSEKAFEALYLFDQKHHDVFAGGGNDKDRREWGDVEVVIGIRELLNSRDKKVSITSGTFGGLSDVLFKIATDQKMKDKNGNEFHRIPAAMCFFERVAHNERTAGKMDLIVAELREMTAFIRPGEERKVAGMQPHEIERAEEAANNASYNINNGLASIMRHPFWEEEMTKLFQKPGNHLPEFDDALAYIKLYHRESEVKTVEAPPPTKMGIVASAKQVFANLCEKLTQFSQAPGIA